MYKDKDKQREANRQASQRQRDKKGMTDDCAKAGIVIPDHPVPVIPAEPEVMVEIDNDGNITPISQPKRGKDIKTFNDLPPDVQQAIRRLSQTNEEFKIRTSIAIKYQHLIPSNGIYKGFMDTLYDPERINNSTGVA